jgi:hypothetical protein
VTSILVDQTCLYVRDKMPVKTTHGWVNEEECLSLQAGALFWGLEAYYY